MIPDPGDAPRHIGLAGLMLAWRQTKMRPHPARGPKAGRIIDGRCKGQRHNRPHAGGRHQPARGRAAAGEPIKTLLDRLELLLEHHAGLQECIGNRLQRVMMGYEIAHPTLEGLGRGRPNLQPKAPQQAP
jgi:hypothetical protein